MKKNNIQKLDELTSGNSGWLENAAKRESDSSWLDLSFMIGLRVLRVLREKGMTQKDLADQMNVTPQYINKIVKGTENLSLGTVRSLNKALSINLMADIAKYEACIEEFAKIKFPDITIKYTSYASIHVVNLKTVIESERAISEPYKNMEVFTPSEKDWCEQQAA